jgi:cytochrome c oxidase cbb3-type subunit I/II
MAASNLDATNTQMKTVVYDDAIVRAFSTITVVWGVVAFLLGVIVAAQLSFWQANFGLEWLSFGRLRPLHTNAAIFAFVGNMHVRRHLLLHAAAVEDAHGQRHASAGPTSGAGSSSSSAPRSPTRSGLTQGKEYAELIWPIDLMVVVVWVIFADELLPHAGDPQREEPLRRDLVLHLDDRHHSPCSTSSTTWRCRPA